jgi:hypothetical protein
MAKKKNCCRCQLAVIERKNMLQLLEKWGGSSSTPLRRNLPRPTRTPPLPLSELTTKTLDLEAYCS